MQENGQAIKRKIQEYFLYFVLYSVVGWLYEVFLEVVVYQWGFSNRGILFGPYCIVYGFGALALLFVLGDLQKKRICVGTISITPLLVFCGIVVLTTGIELLASYIMEAFMGGWQWDYSRFAFHFQGRIAPNPSIRFGLGGMVFLYVLQPLFVKAADKLTDKVLGLITGILAVILSIDFLAMLISRL